MREAGKGLCHGVDWLHCRMKECRANAPTFTVQHVGSRQSSHYSWSNVRAAEVDRLPSLVWFLRRMCRIMKNALYMRLGSLQIRGEFN